MNSGRGTDRVEAVVRWAVVAMLGYWLVYAIVTPVTVWYGHVYNQARLYVIRQSGLVHNDASVTWMQIAFPFDAVHWPFLRLGIGTALPSAACFAGILLVLFVRLRETVSPACAWLCLLVLLPMPTVVYQATSTFCCRCSRP